MEKKKYWSFWTLENSRRREKGRKRKIVVAKERGGGRRKLDMDKFEDDTRKTVGLDFKNV